MASTFCQNGFKILGFCGKAENFVDFGSDHMIWFNFRQYMAQIRIKYTYVSISICMEKHRLPACPVSAFATVAYSHKKVLYIEPTRLNPSKWFFIIEKPIKGYNKKGS